jgi:hypothetical protein
MNRRTRERKKRRITCEILAGDRRQRGIVLDVSSEGLFVQTGRTIDPGIEVEVRIARPRKAEIALRAVVARKLMVDRRLSNVVRGGVGLRVLAAPREYFEQFSLDADETLLDERGGPGAAPRPERGGRGESREARERSFRVRVCLGPRSRSLQVEAKSEEEASRQALARLGEGWEILEITPD